jgi:murein DD-endopeptidase MepM/ murein hydrolase activator NlpD
MKKFKRLISATLTFALVASTIGAGSATDLRALPDFPIEEIGIGGGDAEIMANPQTIPPNSAVLVGASFNTQIGDLIAFNHNYTPSNARVWFGVLEPGSSSMQHGEWRTNGSSAFYLQARHNGTHQIIVFNSSTTAITLTGISGVVRTVTFSPNGGSVNPTSTMVLAGNPIGTLPTPTRSNHRFVGWFTAQTGGTQITANTVINVHTTYWARWEVQFRYVFEHNNNNSPRRIGSGFGDRVARDNNNNRYIQRHRGVDLTAARGTPLYSVGSGRVVRATQSENGSLGYYVVIELDYEHTRPNGTRQRLRVGYGHLDTICQRILNQTNFRINEGEFIGTVGDRGSPGNFHLHFQAITDGTNFATENVNYPNSINPVQFFPHITFTADLLDCGNPRWHRTQMRRVNPTTFATTFINHNA